ncbi:hypothetical protein KU6B_31150 [Mameliella alba]|nr:hypothetical protein KU6B_31150 [Mameliella alba]
MTQQDTRIRTRPDGSIDTAYYMARGRHMRSQAAHAMLSAEPAKPHRRRGLPGCSVVSRPDVPGQPSGPAPRAEKGMSLLRCVGRLVQPIEWDLTRPRCRPRFTSDCQDQSAMPAAAAT